MMTPQETFDYKQKWKSAGNAYTVTVHSDLVNECKTWCRTNLERHQWSMDTYTHVYAHTYWFEHKKNADDFTKAFAEWVDKGTR